MSLDLDCLDERIAACGGTPDCTLRVEDPGCSLFVSEVEVGSHGAALALSPDGGRLYAPVRSQRGVTAMNVGADGRLDCGQVEGSRECAESSRTLALRGDLELPSDPVGITVGDLNDISPLQGTYLLMAHRAGHASLVIDDSAAETLELVDVLDGFSSSLVGVTQRPGTTQAWFARTRGAGIALAGLATLSGGSDEERALFDSGSLAISGVSSSNSGADIREIRFDPRDGVDVVYALSRRPEAILTARTPDSVDARLEIESLVDVGSGPSRLELAVLRGRLYGFVSCFNSRDVYVVDLDEGRLAGVVRGMTGPFVLRVDEDRERIYVADFGASVIRVVALGPLLSCLDGVSSDSSTCAPVVEATLGEPRPVRELQ